MNAITMPRMSANQPRPQRGLTVVAMPRATPMAKPQPRITPRCCRAWAAAPRKSLGAVRSGNREGEHAVEEVGRGCQRGDGDNEGDENGTLQHGETLALEHVDLEVEHGGPDQHGREDLDESETPVREEEPNTLEQHCEGTHQEAERRQQPVPAAQVDEDCLDRLVVTVPDGGDEPRPPPSHLRVLATHPRPGDGGWPHAQVPRTLAFCASNSDSVRTPLSLRSASLASSSTLLDPAAVLRT